MTEENIIPEAPQITAEQLEQCRKSGDFSPVLFEWYKFVGRLCIFYASFRADSPAVRPMPELHYGVLVGLLTRCARLMFSNVVLSHEGLFGETTAILDRCIFDSSVKISWLCTQANKKNFDRFIADGLKSELVFKNKINEIISERGGHVLEIEKRMLTSIENYVATSKLTEIQIESARKLPDLATMIKDINHDRLLYIVGQKLGSHHVHGTWPSLWLHYLEEHDGHLGPRDHNCETHVNQYVFVPLIVLESIRDFVKFVFPDPEEAKPLSQLLEAVGDEIHKINAEVVGNDFEQVKEI